MTVEIDSNSGFCGGVIRAIDGAERILAEKKGLFSLGAIVHNEAELARLRQLGLQTIGLSDLRGWAGISFDPVRGFAAHPSQPCGWAPPSNSAEGGMPPEGNTGPASSRTLLIRAHGEPPETYRLAQEKGFEVVDFTCPVVLKIQKSIREAYERNAPDGQIVIFGKIGHAEVLGLVGQVDGHAVVVEDIPQLEAELESGQIDPSRHVDIFSQTTKSPVEYEELCAMLRSRMSDPAILSVHNTICRQVASRHRELSAFARQHDVIVFVSGRESSNGHVLSNLCKSVNIRTYNVGGTSEVKPEWFRPDDNVGVCGATSTPKWLLEQVADHIKNLH